MGNWRIVIEGIGAHHNDGYEGDANEIGKAMVEELAQKGQTVTAARFEHGLSGNYDNLLAAPAVDDGGPVVAPEPSPSDVQTSAPQPAEPTDLQDAAGTEDPQ